MTAREECREIRLALGVYVVGAIDPAERADVDAHLAECQECREELAGLAGLPALLHRVPLAEAQMLAEDGDDPAAPPEELLHPLLARVAGVRRARRWRDVVAVAAVAVVALGAGAAGATALTGATPPPAAARSAGVTVSGTSRVSGVHLTVKYRPADWGTALAVRVTGIPVGTVCQFRVIDAAGHRSVVGGWRVGYRDAATAWYPASTSLAAGSLRGFQVTSNGKVLVSAAVR